MQKEFGVCVVDYEQVQARTTRGSGTFLSSFGVNLGNTMKEAHAKLKVRMA
jgi:hypothetical protein